MADAAVAQSAAPKQDAAGAPTGPPAEVDRVPRPPRIEPAAKPEGGKMGQQVTVFTNFFQLTVGKMIFHQFHVSTEPEVRGRKMTAMLVKKCHEALGIPPREEGSNDPAPYVFDGLLLFSTTKFENVQVPVVTPKGETYTVTIKHTKELQTGELPPAAAQMCNIILRRVYRQQNLVPVQRNHFMPQKRKLVRNHNMEVWPGYTSSIANYEAGVLLNVDTATKILRNNTILDIMMQVRKANGNGTLEDRLNEALGGTVVMTRYNNKTYKVSHVDLQRLAGEFKFQLKDKSETTVADYMKTRYDVECSPKQPLLVVKGKKGEEVLLVPQLCSPTGMTDEMVSDFRVMKDIGEHTRLTPNQKMGMIKLYRDMLDHKDSRKHLDQWDMQIQPRPLQLKARIIKNQNIMIGNNRMEKAHPQKAQWERMMGNAPLLKPVPLPRGPNSKWIAFYPTNSTRTWKNFLQMMGQMSGSMQLNMQPPVEIAIDGDRTEAYIDAMKSNLNPSIDFVIWIVPAQRSERYDRIKELLSCTMPIPNQCVTEKVLKKDKLVRPVAQKVVMQIQAKLGAELWKTDIPIKDAMVVGIDVYHDTKRKGESILAFTASINQTFTRYWSRPVFQRSGQEIAEALTTAMVAALKAYLRFGLQNGLERPPPTEVFVYRDGVGDGQMRAVLQFEVPMLKKAFEQAAECEDLVHAEPNNASSKTSTLKEWIAANSGSDSAPWAPKLAYIIVRKRGSVRFVAGQLGSLNNPQPGLVVDSGVTNPKRYEFFIQAQQVNQGTATPVNYVVLYFDGTRTADHIQILTYKLCHLYYNWSGTVRVPAPCQYAHKLAFLVGQSVHNTPHARLEDFLYYL